LIEISGDVKSIMAKVESMTDDINYLSSLKNKHNERIGNLEKCIPTDLDSRLRNVEMRTYFAATIVPILITFLLKLTN
jgi:hypothetical protein